ncbi:5-hydroxytryptamine receptor 1D-like [Agrilus planipennis]|uniref:5-hydroxytryptamine receptor 1D-like n=1 Tax=Agrilus planipennis TaxID=224129 RepID=A0A1W4XMI4_AGRPL|nr:5-hydroxytryptamine receptor 1D-like [Agrilus planipennis]
MHRLLFITALDAGNGTICKSNESTSWLCSEALNNVTSKEKQKTPQESKRPLRVSYSASAESAGPTRVASFYSTASANFGGSRPSSFNYDIATAINLESTGRVSSIRRETKTAQTLSIVVGGFVVCWLPFFVYYILTPFLPSTEVNKSPLMPYFTWLGWLNSAINPFIYAFYAPDFRLAFWRLTCKHFSKQRRADVLVQHK